MAAAPEAARHGGGPPPEDESGSDDGGAPAAAGAAAAAAAQGPGGFDFWVDEILWTQGKVAVELIEEVLEAMGGRRAGGPPKAPKARAEAAAVAAAEGGAGAAERGAEGVEACAAAPSSPAAAAASSSGGGGDDGGAAGVVAALAARLGLAGRRSSSSSNIAAAGGGGDPGSSSSAAAGGGPGGSTSEEPPSGGGGGGERVGLRDDDAQLGYRHVGEWQFLWTKSVYGIKAARGMRPGQVVSAIAGLNSLTMKKRMIATLKTSLGLDLACQVAPLSFCLPEELPQWREWLQRHPDQDTGLWMLKTGQDAGKGLRLVPTSSALQAASIPPRHPGRAHTHLKVAQLYITNPLLLHGRKFHLRLWVNVTGHRPLRAYMHARGLVLFSSQEYEPGRPLAAGVRPAASHVTNYARNEDTWVWGLERLKDHFDSTLGPAAWPGLWREMRRRAALGVAAALPSLQAAHAWLRPKLQNYGFQMVGLDFLIDDQMVPWLLEFNSAPSIMAVHSDAAVLALIRANKLEMLSDVCSMVSHRMAAAAGGEGGGGGTPGRPPARPPRRAAADWRRDVEAEMGARGGFEPLMGTFPYGHPGVPWAPEDREMRRLFEERGWPLAA